MTSVLFPQVQHEVFDGDVHVIPLNAVDFVHVQGLPIQDFRLVPALLPVDHDADVQLEIRALLRAHAKAVVNVKRGA